MSPAATEQKAEELSSLILRLSRTREDLDQLRKLLATLRMKLRAVRASQSARAAAQVLA